MVDENIWKRSSSDDFGPVIGIDLGTSNCCAAIWYPTKNRAKIIKNLKEGKFYTWIIFPFYIPAIPFTERTTSTAIDFHYDFNNYTVGGARGVTGFKYLIGMKHINEALKQHFHGSELGIEDDELLGIKCTNQSHDVKIISAEELSSYVLRYLKESCENYLKKKPIRGLPEICDLIHTKGIIRRVVVGVPAHFNEHKREATRAAAHLAGFTEVNITSRLLFITFIFQY